MKKPTEAQRQAAEERRAKFRELTKTISAMSDAERAKLAERMPGIVTVEGHPLSPLNNCAVIMQNNGRPVTIVGGFLQWKKNGRSVKKGEHGSAIWIPAKRPKGETTDEAPDQDQETQKAGRPRFIVGTVFDISQTEPTQGAPRE